MKILILTNELLTSCGVSKHLFELLSEFRNYKELEITIITGGGNDIVIDKFRKLGFEVIVKENFRHDKRSIIGFIKSTIWLTKFISRNQISLIHSHHHYAANIAQVTKIFFQTNTILTNHGILPEIGILSHFPSDNFIAVNRHVVDYLHQKKSNKKVSLIHIGIKNRSNVNKNRNQVLKFISASRIVEDKGIDTFIKAVSLLPEEIKIKAEFLIAGEGDYLPELVKLESKIQSGVKFIGVIEDLQLFMNQTDVFVMTSVSSAEGFPTSLIEAGYARNLIITSDFRGLKDVFENNKDGLIFEAGNFKTLSEKLMLVIQNFETYKNLTENFYRKSIELFDSKVCARKTYDLYKSISK